MGDPANSRFDPAGQGGELAGVSSHDCKPPRAPAIGGQRHKLYLRRDPREGKDPETPDDLLNGVVAALPLAFGLGGRDVAAQLTQSWYEQSQGAAARVKAHQDGEPTGTQPPAPRRATSTDTSS